MNENLNGLNQSDRIRIDQANFDGQSLRIDAGNPKKRVVLPPDEATPEARTTFQCLRITLVMTIEIPLSPGTDRHQLEEDVIDAVATTVVPRVPYLTSLQLAHSMECETDFTEGIRTIHAGRSAEPSTAGD